jgi:putative peptidoglycan lipid II flippase
MGLIAPTILGMAAYELNSFVSISLASGVGAATALQFSLRLQELVLGLFVISISTVVLPLLSAQVKSGDWKAYNQRLMKSLDAVTLFTIPIAAFCMIEGRDIVALLFKSGKFDDQSVNLTAGAFFYHMLGLFFIGQNRILASAFYAREDTKNPTLAGIASFGVNIAGAWLFSIFLEGPGIALALSIASAFNFVLLAMLFLGRRESDRKAFGRSMLYSLRMVGLSLAAAVPVYLLAKPLHAAFSSSGNRFIAYALPLALLALAFGALGLGFLLLTRDENLGLILNRFTRRTRRS